MAGNITIIEPQDNFKRVSKDIIFNEDVDALTLGIYVKILTLGENWQLNIDGLASLLGISSDKIRRSFAVLEQTGFLRRSRVQGKDGRFVGWDYEISSVPFTDIAKTPTSVKTEGRKTPTSAKTDIRKNDMYIYRLNNKTETININTETIKKESARFTAPTIEEVAAHCREKHYNHVDAEAFVAFYQSKGWKVGNAPMKDWRAAVVTWEKRHKDEARNKPSKPSNYMPDDFAKYYEK